MATKQQALTAMKRLGVELDKDSSSFDSYTLDAPTGFIFKANQSESCFIDRYDRTEVAWGGATMSEIWSQIIAVCALGLVAVNE